MPDENPAAIDATIVTLRLKIEAAVRETHLIEADLSPLEDRAKTLFTVRSHLILALEILAAGESRRV